MGSEDVIRVLIVAEDPQAAAALAALVNHQRRPRFPVEHAPDLAQALTRLAQGAIDVVVIDLTSAEASQADLVAHAHAALPGVPIVALIGAEDEERALAAMKAGAQDCLVKPHLDAPIVARSLRYAVERKRAEEAGRRLLHEQAARTQAEEGEARSRFLSQLSDALGTFADDAGTLAEVVDLFVPVLADAALLEIDEDTGEQRSIASRRGDLQSLLGSQASARLEVSVAAPGRREPVGRITLLRASELDAFSPDDAALAGACARKIALAIECARQSRAREEMVSVVSHDLRNPLNVITLALGSLERTSAAGAPVGPVDRIRRSVHRMNRLIADLLDITRLEGSTFPIARTPVEVGPLLWDLLEMHRALAEEKRIALRRETTDELPPLNADRERILQVLANLVGNALKFTPSGGTVTITARATAAGVSFSVIDDGPGISTPDLPKVFNRFWQGGRETRQGAGLGLAIARRIVHLHGGQIGVSSELGAGTTFYFTVPCVASGAVVGASAAASAEVAMDARGDA